MNNGAKDTTKDIQKLQQQLHDIKDQVHMHSVLPQPVTKIEILCSRVPGKMGFMNWLRILLSTNLIS
ncbi:hypothetical protein DPMN_048708 [Dreissena polymorpha]|uniref:Uncharacterized protein n=1 Tax=Dreissena polymorpha TaxID=45954 RepID=A0A9D4DDW4_DREPO|nr:hypothetical protein DPMN_048708 [Dreissena polymorpha]